MWVQLLSVQHIAENGRQVMRHPGDWVNVGRQTATLWISRGEARVPEATEYREITMDGAGVIVMGDFDLAVKFLEPYKDKLKIEKAKPCLPWKKTVIFDPAVKTRPEFFPIGLGLLDTWQMAAPILSYDILAVHTGSEEEKEKTKAIVHDLRVPLYDSRLVFIKDAQETREVVELWRKELDEGADRNHALLRSIYRIKPYVLSLPVTWNDINAHP